MILGVLVVPAVALHHFEGVQVNLHRFNYPAVYPCGEYEGVGFLVVFRAENADVLHLAFLVILLDAFKHLHRYLIVGDYQPEELGFECLEILLTLLLLEQSPLLTLTPFNLHAPLCLGVFLSVLGFNPAARPVVYLYEIFGADVLGVAYVLAQVHQHSEIVAPHGYVVDLVAVAFGD